MSSNETPTAILTLKPGRDKPMRQRHPWIFSGAIKRVEGSPQPGELVDVLDIAGNWLARAYYNGCLAHRHALEDPADVFTFGFRTP